MKKFIIIFLCLCYLTTNNGQSSNDNVELVVRASADFTALNISWYPVDSKLWKKMMESGYTLERQEIDEAGDLTGRSIVLNNNIRPQNQQWFIDNQDSDVPLLEPIRSLLYDEEFDFETREGLNETDLKFNYIAYEAINDPVIAYGTGLGYIDTEVEVKKKYRYTVKANDGSISGYVDIGAFFSAFQQNPISSPHEFEFPGDLSLSGMYTGKETQDNKIVGLARAYGDSIVVRWAPPNALVWESAKKDGFTIYRTEGWGDPELLAEVKPRPKADMDASLLERDSIAFMAAGLLYGQFEEPEAGGLYDQKSMAENYYGMAMMAAEQSPLAADILGFRFVDKEVEIGAQYTYLVFTKSLPNISDVGMIDVSNIYTDVATPAGFYLTPGDKSIQLNWSRDLNINQFSYYKVERSRDGINYEQINGAPIVFMDSDLADFASYYFVDSVGINDVNFYYRLSGGNSFGEWSTPAEEVGMAVDLTPPPSSLITFGDYQDSLERFVVEWVQRDELPTDFAFYQIMMSETRGGFYSAISEPLDASVDSFYFDVKGLELEGQYYFKVAGEDKKGNRSESEAFPARVPDRTSPDIPVSLKGYVDSLGRVEVTWERSEAKDTKGYWLYWSNDPDDEMSLVSKEIITDNYHTWYIKSKSLNKKIYFCLRVEDYSYNRSNPSDVLELKRPDKIAPIPPVIQPVRVDLEALEVNWMPSPSEDVNFSLLYKRFTDSRDTSWFLLDTIKIDVGTYLDKEIKIDEAYQYRVCSVDEFGNTSDFSAPSQGVFPFPAERTIINDLSISSSNGTNESLSWSFEKGALLEGFDFVFDIYRSTGTGGLRKVDTVPGTNLTYTDQKSIANVLYNYAVRVRFNNGWVGDLSEVKSVLIE